MKIDEKIVMKFLRGDASPREIQLVKKWMDNNPSYVNELNRVQEQRFTIQLRETVNRDFSEQKSRIFQQIELQRRFVNRSHARWVAGIAALFIGVVFILGGWLISKSTTDVLNRQVAYVSSHDLQYGVALCSGTVVPIDEFHNTILVSNDCVVVNGVSFAQATTHHHQLHAIRTRYGQTAEVQFADGTSVVLNANSNLQFPHHFSAKKREVMLDGEGYFEVTKSPTHPFVVHTSLRDVEVLGTTFSVEAYQAARSFSTVLVEGSVAIDRGNTRCLLQRNEAYTLTSKHDTGVVTTVDPISYTAWHEHKLPFRHSSVSSITQELTQFYGVEIVISDPEVATAILTGTLYLQPNVEQTLSALLQTLPAISLTMTTIDKDSQRIEIRTHTK